MQFLHRCRGARAEAAACGDGARAAHVLPQYPPASPRFRDAQGGGVPRAARVAGGARGRACIVGGQWQASALISTISTCTACNAGAHPFRSPGSRRVHPFTPQQTSPTDVPPRRPPSPPSYAKAHFRAALALDALGRTSDAASAAARATALDPGSGQAAALAARLARSAAGAASEGGAGRRDSSSSAGGGGGPGGSLSKLGCGALTADGLLALVPPTMRAGSEVVASPDGGDANVLVLLHGLGDRPGAFAGAGFACCGCLWWQAQQAASPPCPCAATALHQGPDRPHAPPGSGTRALAPGVRPVHPDFLRPQPWRGTWRCRRLWALRSRGRWACRRAAAGARGSQLLMTTGSSSSRGPGVRGRLLLEGLSKGVA